MPERALLRFLFIGVTVGQIARSIGLSLRESLDHPLINFWKIVFPVVGHLVLEGDLSGSGVKDNILLQGDAFLAGGFHSFSRPGSGTY